MSNVFKQLKALLNPDDVQIAKVAAYANGIATVTLPGGGQTRVRGEAAIETQVFIKAGAIEGPAPNLTVVVDVI